MNIATKKWILLKISSLILIPLMFWFILNFVSIYDKSFEEVLGFFSNINSKLLFSSFIVIAFLFSALSISEVFEDYISENNLKNVANRLLYFSAIIIPLITIMLMFKINL
jgi:succinate dehydrogenase / fumarate reductase, membrane anchor subunit